MFTQFFWDQAMNMGGGRIGLAHRWATPTSEVQRGRTATPRGFEEAKSEPANPALNRAIGFTSLLTGVASGMILGLWSFGGPLPVPTAIGEYGDLPRRLLRLGHIAFFGLGLINLAIAGHWRRLDLDRQAARRALWLMNLGNLGLPPLLLAAAWQPVLLYLMPAPVVCVFAALALCAVGAWRACVAASFGTGEGYG
jgi:hypothetical protein